MLIRALLQASGASVLNHHIDNRPPMPIPRDPTVLAKENFKRTSGCGTVLQVSNGIDVYAYDNVANDIHVNYRYFIQGIAWHRSDISSTPIFVLGQNIDLPINSYFL